MLTNKPIGWEQEASELAVILRNCNLHVQCDHERHHYVINGHPYVGVLSFISAARRGLKAIGINVPLP